MNHNPGFLAEVFTGWQGEGPWVGKRQLFIRLAGCNHGCSFCDTVWATDSNLGRWTLHGAKPRFYKNPVAASALMRILEPWARRQIAFDSIAVTGGEPLEQPWFLETLLPALKKRFPEAKILLETNGLHAESLQQLRSLCDYISADIKLASISGRPEPTRPYADFLAAAVAAGLDGCVKIVVGPQTPAREVTAAARVVKSVAPGWDLILQPMTGPEWRSDTLGRQLENLFAAAVRIHHRSRLIPQVHRFMGWV